MTNSTLIVKHFPVPKKPEPVQHFPHNHRRQQQQHPATNFVLGAAQNEETGGDTPWVKTEAERAEKRGLTVVEYRRRISIVLRASNTCPFSTGDTVWPAKAEDREMYGQCIVMSIVRHFDSYGDVEWHEPPFILSLKPQKHPATVINANVEWCVKRVEIPAEEGC